MTAIIEFQGISKAFGTTLAVDNVSLSIEEGAFFALLGPSGCGKTTLLRMLAGFETPTGGRILIDGKDITSTPPNRRPVNMVFQSYAVFPHLTVEKNIAYGLRMDGVAASERGERVAAALAMVQLDGLGGRMPDQLSGGQRQRVALARAIVKRPRVLLLDEPLSALDAKLRADLRFELSALQDQLGITFVMVTHDQDEALALATRCAVMHEGRLEQVATPTDLYEHPVSRRVADFIGAINLFEARPVGSADGQLLLDLPEAGIRARLTHAGAISDAPLWLGVRPEKIRLLKPGEAPAEAVSAGHNAVAGTILDIAYLGSESVFDIALETGKRMRVVRPNLGPGDQDRFTWDETVQLSWPADAAILLRE